MIMRIWHGWTRRGEDAEAYDTMLKNEILPGIHRIDGYQGSYLLRRDSGDEVEFITITTWDSWDAIREFAGDGNTGAVIYPKAHALLTRFDERSEHYDATWVG
jgi:heme-degrading monooxygenase HmoA